MKVNIGKALTAGLLCGLMVVSSVSVYAETGTSTYGGVSFSDVNTSDWFYDPVQYMVKRGAVSGYGNDKFLPLKTISRAEFGSILFNTVKPKGELADKVQKEALAKDNYNWAEELNEINPEYWGNRVISVAEHYDMMSHVEHSQADWSNNITRAEMAQLVIQTAEKVNNEEFPIAQNIMDCIADYNIVRLIPQYDQIAKAYTAGVISGDNNGVFNPAGTATRAEACVAVRKLVEKDSRKSLPLDIPPKEKEKPADLEEGVEVEGSTTNTSTTSENNTTSTGKISGTNKSVNVAPR